MPEMKFNPDCGMLTVNGQGMLIIAPCEWLSQSEKQKALMLREKIIKLIEQENSKSK